MNLKRTTIIFVGAAALAAWFSAAMTPGRPPRVSDAVAPPPIDAAGADLAREVARLHDRLRPDPTPRVPARSPFSFRSARRAAPGPVVSAPAPNETPAVADATRFRLTLAGVAEDPAPGGGDPIRTAIIAGNGQLFLAKENDTVADRDVEYKVGKISADGVELRDLRDGTVRRLTFK